MTSKSTINKFIKSQKSIQYYKNVQRALKEVLLRLSNKEYKKATNNLILMVLHEGALGQVMHFKQKNNFKIMQLTIPKRIPKNVLKYLIAHELGHVMQGQNWKKRDGLKLEKDANNFAKKIGFEETKLIFDWIKKHKNKRNKSL